MRLTFLILLLQVATCLTMSAQTEKEKTIIRKDRFTKVDFMHAGIGIEAGGADNIIFGPKVSYGIGSYRNLLNVDVGFGYEFCNLIGIGQKERIILQQLPVFIDLHLNILRWKSGAVYMGGEAAYYINTMASHHRPVASGEGSIKGLGRNYSVLTGILGVRLDRWDFSVRYMRYLAPMINQKLVFETEDYDYDYLHDSVFERSRIMLNATYLLPF